MTRRLAFLVLLCCAVLASPAQAKLRSPHLESSCANGFAYGEITEGNWRVEGCHKTGSPQAGENDRTLFKGVVELNGMLVEGSNNLILTSGVRTIDGFQHHFQRVTRDNGKLVLDPKIGGNRRRIVLYSGDVDLELLGRGTKSVLDVHGITASAPLQGDKVDIPVGSSASILGFRLHETIHDTEVSASVDGGSIVLNPRMRMGAAASALLRDWEAKVKIETVDGTGMKITGLKFAIPNIAIPGIGGFKDLHVEYDGSRDEWSGGVNIDFGSLFPGIDFEMAVSATTGAPTKIQVVADLPPVALGPTGIFLDELRGGFATNPLVLNTGITVTAGPKFGGFALVQLDGDIELTLEPNFRMENTGHVRLFPYPGGGQVADGSAHVILDSRGYLSIGGNAGFEQTLFGIGASASLSGNGAYSTTGNKFDIEASATGRILLGDLGGFDIVHFEAVTSSNGWGACGHLLLFLNGGVGEEWDHNPKVLLSCDLSQFEANVPDPGGRVAGLPRAAGDRAKTFTVAKNTGQLAIEIQADAPDPRVALQGPDGKVVAATATTGPLRRVDDNTIVAAPTGSAVQHIFLKDPAAGQYTLRWDDQGGQVTGARFARDLVPMSADVSVTHNGGSGSRLLSISKIKGISPSDHLMVGVMTPNGMMPVVETTTEGGSARFKELANGSHDIVGRIIRDGIPLPGSLRVLGHYDALQPPPPVSINAKAQDGGYSVLAKAKKGAELPDAWQYVAKADGIYVAAQRAKPGARVDIDIPEGYQSVKLTARGVVDGQMLTKKYTKSL